MDYTNHYIIDGQDCWTTWGVIFTKGTYPQLLKRAKRKEVQSKSWAEEQGTERYIPATVTFESRSLSLPVAIIASGESDLQTKLDNFLDYISITGYFNLDVVDMNRRFKLLYDDTTDINIETAVTTSGDIVAKFSVTLIDDFPTDKNTIPIEWNTQ